MFKYCTKFVHKQNYWCKNIFDNNQRTFLVIHNKIVVPNLYIAPVFKPQKRLYTQNARISKLFVERENAFAYDLLPRTNVPPVSHVEVTKEVTNTSDFESFLDQDWRSAQPNEIVAAFESVCGYCIANNLCVSDNRFDKLVDGLMDKVEKLSKDEIARLLICLAKYPPEESFKSHNFHDIWSALDDVCCWRLKEWDIETMFYFGVLWYKLSLGKVSDYIYEVLEKVSKKPERLTKDQLVHTFFYMNICRKRSIDFGFENAVEVAIKHMNIDEMAIIAMGFFKTQSKVKLPNILLTMITRLKEEINSVHEISLTSILKVIRFSNSKPTIDGINELFEPLMSQISRLSLVSCLHIALLGTSLQIFHEGAINAVSQKIINSVHDVDKVRLKDIERLLLVLAMFDHDPQTTPNAFEVMVKELCRDERLVEKVRHPRCLPIALHFLSIKNFYPYDLISHCLDSDYILEIYGKNVRMIPREIFSLDCSMEIECPDYTGNKLQLKSRYKAAKWLTEFAPTHDQVKKKSAADMLMLDVLDVTYRIVGNKQHVFVHHIVPHFSKADIVLCVDKKTNNFVKPLGFENYILGDVMRPFNTTDFFWYAITPVNLNTTIRGTSRPIGLISMKKRHLEKIGYKSVVIVFNEYLHLTTSAKINLILDKMKRNDLN